MALCCSSGESYLGTNLISCRSRNVDFEVKGLRFKIRPTPERCLFSKVTVLVTAFRGGKGNFCFGKWKLNAGIRSELQPSAEVNSGHLDLSSLKECGDVSVKKVSGNIESDDRVDLDNGSGSMDFPGGSGGNGKFPPGGGGGDDGDNSDDHKEEEFGPLLKYDEVIKEVEARGARLPSDMLEAAKASGIQKLLLYRYLDLQASAWPIGVAVKSCAIVRNRMLADPSFLFKVGTEIIIDSCCATFAEVQKRGKDFWAEFELHLLQTVYWAVLHVLMELFLAVYLKLQDQDANFQSNSELRLIFISDTFMYWMQGLLYGSVGFACGLIGQGIANFIMTAKRTVKKTEEDIPVPPLIQSAALWGVFLAVSSNTRYQIINGLERLVEGSSLAKQSPPIAMAFTVGVRFTNNIYGGMQFVDWARWSGVQ
ncbi:hypothetical protein MUK42_11946 [Musa troglodytarum]|uniref:Uncharacterized protein n=1 Tax=Musa troglodytarum TaxID=320322 RepID=A0A9E7GIK4_9LILI|nr:hypothetical protein MUK42_11946 [Musa troglodytarum]